MAENVILNVMDIQKVLPHRYPFLMVDKVIELVSNERIVAVKNVTANEPFFMGHFPNRPVMPGVMMLEAMAQAAALLALKSDDGVKPGQAVLLVGAEDFKWKRIVLPGDTLVIEMTIEKKRRPFWKMRGTAKVDGKLAAEGSVSAMENEA